MPLSKKQVQIDKIQVGFSPRFTGIQADTTVRDGEGILTHVTITGAAGAVIDFFDGPAASAITIAHFPATTGPGTYTVNQTFANGLHMSIATSATDMIVGTGGL